MAYVLYVESFFRFRQIYSRSVVLEEAVAAASCLLHTGQRTNERMDDWAIIRFSLSSFSSFFLSISPSLCSVETVEAFLFTRFTSLSYFDAE